MSLKYATCKKNLDFDSKLSILDIQGPRRIQRTTQLVTDTLLYKVAVIFHIKKAIFKI